LRASLLLALLGPSSLLARLSAFLFGLGALGYGVYWLLAGLLAPGLGSTGAAKESLAWLAVPGAAMCILGLVGMAMCAFAHMFSTPGRD
jgi:multisubunit Na+/H+ antiporter MnhB subunit